MALKSVFNITNNKSRTCLKCNRKIDRAKLKDNELYKCVCGQVHFVDIYKNGSCSLTVKEKPQLRRRHEEKDFALLFKMEQKKMAELTKKIFEVGIKAEEATESGKEWEAAAEGLAKVVEQLKAAK